ncbi:MULTISPECIES: protein kinase domain-containing protein [Streptomyces]|uniref:Protein kinase n=2 Tax=Streptomyces rimosus subsp. rimosus TaxID=132474 RepID=L8EEK8_STRR1|nr:MULTISPECIES: protein kinase [Streptomyces]KOG67468.1 serine/threonine protein kinase [Kitasatospora aureofaciens]MYT46978.1 protein kinase [Streptomyces sp. SID5471]KEF09202.1 serine/threonine protein kinase [Streptomyces rimosus]KEF19220.1 serine/threonine protein kinase [Streptomyces rimosus]KOT28572.1 serine/threonine protein kinase [Streptomyces rimosus subsp. rimosus]
MDGASATPPPGVRPGYRIGDWRLGGPIGAGSWGSVYAAEHTADGRPAAVKILRTDLLAPGQRAWMDELVRREVRFSLEADHPHLVRTHAALTIEDPDHPGLDGLTALVMDRAEHSLRDLLADAAGRPLPDGPRLLREVADGLAHLHGRGWVHGDLKPANILLAPDGTAWLADFGLAAELEGSHAYVPPLGSLDHVPPEWWSQRTGQRGATVRPTADIWAYGVLAHQVLTGGRHPFPGRTARARALAAQTYAHGGAPLRLDGQLPPGWRELIGDCLLPDHASRARHTAAELSRRVRRLCDAPGVRHRAARRPALLAAGAALLLALAGSAGVLLTSDSRSGPAVAGASSPASASASSSAEGIAGALPEDSDVPRALRPYITRAAERCTEQEVTPALIAAMLKTESGFDPHARRKDEYGIAMWTPWVFHAWAVDGDHDGREDYWSPPDAIASMGSYLCWLAQQFKAGGLRDGLPELVAAGYRTSSRVVLDTGGVPARTRDYVDRVARQLARYSR